MKSHQQDTTELELAEIELRVAARDYADHAEEVSDFQGARLKHYAALLCKAAENYAAVRAAAARASEPRWKLSS